MKLHLPKQLFTALLAALTLATPTALTVASRAWADSISVNFHRNNQDDEKVNTSANANSTLLGVDAEDWNDVRVGEDGENTQNITVNTADGQTATMALTTKQAAWAPGSNLSTLEATLQKSYLDVNNSNDNKWSFVLTGIEDWWIFDTTFYMSGDGSTAGKFAPITVNGVNYIGGVNQTGSESWGTRIINGASYNKTGDCAVELDNENLNSINAVRVTSYGTSITATTYGSSGRGTLAGIQVVDRTAEMVYTSTIGTSATLSEVDWSKQGVEGSSSISSIQDAASQYFSIAADAAGSALDMTETTTIAGLQLAANNLTVSSANDSVLTTGALHANSGTMLTMNVGLAGENLTLSGMGTIVLGNMNYSGTVTVGSATTVQLLSNTKGWSSFSNSGTVHVNAGSEAVVLNNLVGKDKSLYNPSCISNTATGNLVISHTGNKTLSDNITIANGGTVTLKGGTFGTESAAITNSITSENNTVLALEDIQAYIGSGDGRILNINVEVGNNSTLHVGKGDAFKYTDTILTVKSGGVVELGTTRQSLGSSSKVVLAGGTINGQGDSDHQLGLDFYEGGTIETTANSILNTLIGSHDNKGTINLKVVGSATLTMTGSFNKKGAFEKSDSGTLIYKGAAFAQNLTISGGVFEYNLSDNRTHTGNISGSGTLRKSGSGVLTLDSALTSVTTLGVTEGKLVYNSTSDSTHTLTGNSGTTFEKTGAGALTVTSNNYAGSILVSAGTLKNGAENGNDRAVSVDNGAKVDINGNAAYYNLTLQSGAIITNTGADVNTNKKQLHTITLTGDAFVEGSNTMGMVGSNHITSHLKLNGHTLTQRGTNNFILYNTTVESAGLILINSGKVQSDGNDKGTTDLSKASLELNGGTFQLSTKDACIDNLSLTSGSVTIDPNCTLTTLGAVTMSGGSVSGNLQLSSAITLTGGGEVDLSDALLSGTSLAGFRQLETAKPTASGLQSLTYELWSGEGSVTSDQSTINIGGTAYTMDASTGTFTTAGTVYYVVAGDTLIAGGDNAADGTANATAYVVDGTLNVNGAVSSDYISGESGIVTVAEGVTLTLGNATSTFGTLNAAAGTVSLTGGSTVVLGDGVSASTHCIGTVNVDGASTIRLQDQATLRAFTKAGNGTIMLTGSGVYDMGANAESNVTGLGDKTQWTGTVVLNGVTKDGINFNDYGNAESTIQLINVSGHVNSSPTTYTADFILGNATGESVDAYTHTNGYSDNTYTFSGRISGTGNMVNNTDKVTIQTKFTGDVSKWTGSYIQRSGTTSVLTFSGAANYVNAAITRNAGTINLTVSTDESAQFKGAVNVSALTLNQSASFNAGLSANTVSVAADKALTLNNAENATLATVISGAGSFIKTGSGVLTLSGASTYTGGTVVAGGELKLDGSSSALGSGMVTVESGATLNANGKDDAMAAISGVTLKNGSCLKNTTGNIWAATDQLSNLILDGDATVGGDVRFGLVKMPNSSTWDNTILKLNGHTLTIENTAGFIFAETQVTGEGNTGTIRVASGGKILFGHTERADTSNLSGAIIENNGTLYIENQNTNVQIAGLTGTGSVDSTGTLTLAGDGSYEFSGSFVANAGNLAITGRGIHTYSGTGVLNQTLSIGTGGTFVYKNSADVAYEKSISGAGLFKKAGTGTLTLRGTNSYTGGTLISGGTLIADNASALGSGAVEINGGALQLASDLNVASLLLKGSATDIDINGNTLNVNGGYESDVKVYVEGGGRLVVKGSFDSSSTVGVKGGAAATIELSGKENEVKIFDLSDEGKSEGTILLKEGSSTTITNSSNLQNDAGTLWMSSKSTVALEESAELVWLGASVIGKENGGTVSTSANKNVHLGLEEAKLSNLDITVEGTGFHSGADTPVVRALLEASSLTNNSGAEIQISNSGNTITTLAATGGSVKLSASMSVDSISAREEKSVTVVNVSTVSMANGTVAISGHNGADAIMTAKSNNALAQMAKDASFTIEDMVLTNTEITAASVATRVNLSNVSTEGVQLAQGNFKVLNPAGDVSVGTGGRGGSFSTELLSGITLNAGNGSSITVDLGDLTSVTPMGPGKYDLSITLSGFYMDSYTDLQAGAGVLFAADSWLGQLLTQQGATAWVEGSNLADGEAAAAGTGGVSVSYISGGDNVGTIINITGLNVPEPATSTLSLLALAGLMARRRRK